MKTSIFITCLLSLCFITNPALAQKLKSDAVLETSLTEAEKSKSVLETEKSKIPAQGMTFPKQEEKPLVSVQEPKIQVAAQKKIDKVTPSKPETQVAKLGKYDDLTEPLVITATRSAQPISHIGMPVTIITHEQIKKAGYIQVLDALRNVPGVNVVRSGTRGRTTSIFMRGANANQVMFMINGTQVMSPTTGFFDPTNLLIEDVEKIEIIRGPQSTLYGSEAMAGVINVITREGKKGRPHLEGQFEYGSEETFDESGTINGGVGPISYSGSFSRLDTGAGVRSRRLEKDNFEDTNASGRMKIELPFFNSNVDTYYKYSNGITPIDDGAFRNDFNAWQRTRDNLVSTSITMNPFSWLTEILKFSFYNSRLGSADPGDTPTQASRMFKLDTHAYTFDWQNTIHPFETNTLIGGYEYEYQQADNRTFDKILRNNGFYIEDQQSFWGRLFLTAGIRFEKNSSFGNAANPKFSAAYLLKETGTKFKGSYGTGFRTPTLNELFFPNFGNPDLQPETSQTYEWGVEQYIPIWNSRLEADMYHTHFIDLIQAVTAPTGGAIAANTGKANTDGLELSMTSEPIPGFMQVKGNYTFLQTEDKSISGGPLIRRPKHTGGVMVNFHFWDRWNVNLEALFANNRQDRTFAPGRPPRETNFGYGVLNIMLSYELCKYLELYARSENITNTDYNEVLGFQSPGALFFGGVRAKV